MYIQTVCSLKLGEIMKYKCSVLRCSVALALSYYPDIF